MSNTKSIRKQYLKILVIEKLLYPLRVLPIRSKRIMFISWMGYHYAGNPRCLAEYIHHMEPNIEIIFGVKDDPKKLEEKHEGIKFVKFGSLKYFMYALSSKVFVTDGGGVSYIPFKKKQFVIDTWHGGGAYKLVSLGTLENADIIKKYVFHDAKKRNMFISTCKKATEYYQRVKLLPREVIFEVGMPRNDIFFRDTSLLSEEIKVKLKIKEYRTVLYAPTFRDYEENAYDWKMPNIDFSIDNLLDTFERKFGGKWMLLYRGHPNVQIEHLSFNSNRVINVTEYQDMQELLIVSDALITDYSSIVWDYALTKKPGFLYTPDLEKYKKFRGFETPIEKWMYSICNNENELIEAVTLFDAEKHINRVDIHMKMMGCCENGNATELIGEKIFEQCYESRK